MKGFRSAVGLESQSPNQVWGLNWGGREARTWLVLVAERLSAIRTETLPAVSGPSGSTV